MLDLTITEQISDPDFLFRLMADHQRALNTDDHQLRIQRLTREIEQNEERKRRLKVLFINGELDETEYQGAKANFDKQISSAHRQLAQFKPDKPVLSRAALAELVSPFCEWDILTHADRRALLSHCPGIQSCWLWQWRLRCRGKD